MADLWIRRLRLQEYEGLDVALGVIICGASCDRYVRLECSEWKRRGAVTSGFSRTALFDSDYRALEK